MLVLAFEGYVQIRLATDPDPTDEPRGVSGWTFAVANEPDLDRVLVLQDNDPRRVRRSHGPSVGVTVRQVILDNKTVADHVLNGASVNLLDAPKFEGRNWIIADDGNEPLDPFRIRIKQADTVLEKEDVLTNEQGEVIPLYRAEPQIWARRRPVGAAPAQEVLDAIGVKNPVQWRLSRKELLQKDLPNAATAAERCAIEKRIRDLDIKGPAIGTVSYGMHYDFALHGPGGVTDTRNKIGMNIDFAADWPIQFWVGGWDADALCAYMRGKVSLPII
jgi:hypothetical protein